MPLASTGNPAFSVSTDVGRSRIPARVDRTDEQWVVESAGIRGNFPLLRYFVFSDYVGRRDGFAALKLVFIFG